MKYPNLREETLKNKVAQDFFGKLDCTEVIGDIDFTVNFDTHDMLEPPLPLQRRGRGDVYLFWDKAKQKSTDVLVMLTQLVLTIGKARTFDKILPPPFLGCFDCEKIAFVPYADIQDIFYQNDFNWKVIPSDHETREFKQIYAQLKKIIYSEVPWETFLFDFEKDEKDLKRFIRQTFDNKGIFYAQFFLRIFREIPDAILASFSTPKFIKAQSFFKFRKYFTAKFLKGFICQANTFDNVNGHFLIGFFMCDLNKKETIFKIDTNVILSDVNVNYCWQEGEKSFHAINERIFSTESIRIWVFTSILIP